ncbi:hypothetical protein AAGS61_11800 [Lysinibacillus sp. KU-BSD001]|uniref:hypothetical protein n=1 Tax=Lysinibacillus sp. KU-BSD001 TaxID=3141328 RepID=UPI0036E630BA
MMKIAVSTSLMSAFYVTAMLRILDLFKWIDWKPTKFLNTIISDGLTRWIALFVILFVVSIILFMILQFVQLLPPVVWAIIIGLLMAFLTEWLIYDLPMERASFKRLSIPFFVVVLTAFVFLTETASFHRKSLENRNKLPYDTSAMVE